MNNIENLEKYHAFISYSHQDEKFAKWLHTALEKYKIDSKLFNEFPDLPSSLFPIFRDREELPTSTNLSQNINDALKDSKYLIVICSPEAAKSFWVNSEILTFKKIHGNNRILPIIISGEPNASDKKQFKIEAECFPNALKYRIDSDGNLTDERIEPIAADARRDKDGKQVSKLKLIAGILGIPFDTLYRREEKRRRKFRIVMSGIAIALILFLGGLAWYSLLQKTHAENALKKANYNIALAQFEKAHNLSSRGNNNLANLFAYNSLLNLKTTFNITQDIEQVRSFVLLNPPLLHKIDEYTDKKSPGFSCIVSSPSGNQLAAGTMDGSIVIIDNKTKKEVVTFRKHEDRITSLAYSPDGKWLVSADSSHIYLWSLNSFKCYLFESDLQQSIRDIKFSPDGKKIVSCEYKTVNIWDVHKRKLIMQRNFDDGVRRIAFLSNNKFIVGTVNGEIVLLNFTNAEKRILFKAKGVINGLAISPDSNIAIATTDVGKIHIWKIENDKFVNRVSKSVSNIEAFAVKWDRDQFITASENGYIWIWNINNGELLTSQRGNNSTVLAITTLLNSDIFLFAGYESNAIQYWKVNSTNGTKLLKGEMYDPSNNLDISADGKWLLSANVNRIQVWNLITSERMTVIGDSENIAVSCAYFSNDSKKIAFGIQDTPNKIYILNLENNKINVIPTKHESDVENIVFSSDGHGIASISSDGSYEVFNIDKNISTVFKKGSKDFALYDIALNETNKFDLYGWDDGKSIKNLLTNTVVFKNKRNIEFTKLKVFSKEKILITIIEKKIYIYDFLGNALANIQYADEISSFSYSPNSHLLAVHLFNGDISVRSIDIDALNTSLDVVKNKIKYFEDQSNSKIDGIRVLPYLSRSK